VQAGSDAFAFAALRQHGVERPSLPLASEITLAAEAGGW